jgi:hypothetical protein
MSATFSSKRSRRAGLAIAVALALALASTSAAAHVDAPAIVAAVQAAATTIWTNITNGFTSGIGKLAGVVESTGKMQIQAQQESTKQINEMQSEVAKNAEIYKLGKAYELPPDPCTTGAISSYIDNVNRAHGGIASSFQPGGSRSQLTAFSAANAAVNASDDIASETRAAMIVNAHGRYFCDGTERPGCTTLGVLPGGDIRAESLFSGAKAKPGDLDTLTFNKQQIDAARTYINNATVLMAIHGLTKEQAGTAAGTEYLAMALSAKARNNLANKGMLDALARRVPVPEAKELVDSIVAGNPSAAAYYAKMPNLKTEGISLLDLMDAEVGRRYRNPKWLVAMSAASPEAVAREAAIMQAWQMDMAMKQFLLNERIEIALGQILGTLVRQEAGPQLAAKYGQVRPGGR